MKNHSDKETTEKVKGSKFNFFVYFVLVVLLGTFFLQYRQVAKVGNALDYLEERDSAMIAEIGKMRETYGEFGGAINEVRQFLLLPTKDFSGLSAETDVEQPDSEDGSQSAANSDKLQLAMFKYIDYVGSSKLKEANVANFKAYLDAVKGNENLAAVLSKHGLKAENVVEDNAAVSLAVTNASGENVLFLYLSKEEGKLLYKSALKKEEVQSKNAEEFIDWMSSYLDTNIEAIESKMKQVKTAKESVGNYLNGEEAKKIAGDLNLTIKLPAKEDGMIMKYEIVNVSEKIVGEVELNLETYEIALIDKNDPTAKTVVQELKTAFGPFLSKLDNQSVIDKKTSEAKQKVENTIGDSGFQLLLKQNKLEMSLDQKREDDQRIYYDIFDVSSDQKKLFGSMVVEKTTGVVNIVDQNGTNSDNLLLFDPEEKKKIMELPTEIPEYDEEVAKKDGEFNILIAGKHGSLVDTMIFAHINEERGDVRMISIPRDLFYNGRKINAYASSYGMPELKRVLSQMTGYELDKYILIDMYAFIDVIDLIGGVDVTLEKAVIDPTYRTVDNGVVGTLHYEPGTYHLGGKEALRLARSRHTSSDFARADRQQLILKSLQAKAKNFGFGDAETLYQIVKAVLAKTESDITFEEAIAYYFRYQNFDIKSNDVMSSGNVLYVPPYTTSEQCNALIAAAAAAGQPRPGCEGANKAYTLLPRNDNWNVIKWFFRDKFTAELAVK